MRRFFGLLLVIVVTAYVSPANASFKPNLTPAEQQTYHEMTKADSSAVQAYIDTRNYISICQQALKQPSRILEIGIEPKNYNEKYATPDEAKMVKRAIFLWMKATIGN